MKMLLNINVSYLFFPIAIFIAGVALALSFLKINEQPFTLILINAFLYFFRPRLYVWQRVAQSPQKDARKALQKETPVSAPAKKISWSKISELAWSLDVKDRIRE